MWSSPSRSWSTFGSPGPTLDVFIVEGSSKKLNALPISLWQWRRLLSFICLVLSPSYSQDRIQRDSANGQNIQWMLWYGRLDCAALFENVKSICTAYLALVFQSLHRSIQKSILLLMSDSACLSQAIFVQHPPGLLSSGSCLVGQKRGIRVQAGLMASNKRGLDSADLEWLDQNAGKRAAHGSLTWIHRKLWEIIRTW